MTKSRGIRKKSVSRIVRTNPIEQHYTDCLKCGNVHNVELLMKYYKRQDSQSMHYLCDVCNHRMRLATTTRGYLVFHKQTLNSRGIKQWDEIFQTVKIDISEEVKDWLTKSFQPPRKRSVKTIDK